MEAVDPDGIVLTYHPEDNLWVGSVIYRHEGKKHWATQRSDATDEPHYLVVDLLRQAIGDSRERVGLSRE